LIQFLPFAVGSYLGDERAAARGTARSGSNPQAATHYLVGHVDDGRLLGTGPDDGGPQ
jgi:hypothetical protein